MEIKAYATATATMYVRALRSDALNTHFNSSTGWFNTLITYTGVTGYRSSMGM